MSFFRLLILLPLLLLVQRPAAAFEETNKSYFGDIALGGYDAVSYFTQSMASKGEEAYSYEWNGAKYLFSSAANRSSFAARPAAFAPQYGGYCSNQMSLGNLSDIDPEVWRIIEGKLYLFGHQAGRLRWADDSGQKVVDANGHWRNYIGR
jgi:YHS domain-containing protein